MSVQPTTEDYKDICDGIEKLKAIYTLGLNEAIRLGDQLNRVYGPAALKNAPDNQRGILSPEQLVKLAMPMAKKLNEALSNS